VTANDSDVSDGETLTGSQVVRVYGRNLTAPFVVLTFEGVEYTPLECGEDYIEYLLGDNGTATIAVDGKNILSFSVEDVIIPEELPFYIDMSQRETRNIQSPAENERIYRSVNCANYPFLKDENLPYFGIRIGNSQLPFQDFDNLEGHNCEIANRGSTSSYIYCVADVTDVTIPAYVTYKDFIIAVFNYTND